MGLERLQNIAQRHGATIRYKPVELPRIFATTGYQPLAQRPPALLSHRMYELRRWRAYLGIRMNLEPKHFPVPDKLACLTIIAAQLQGHEVGDLTSALMRACWVDERDISDPGTVAAIVDTVGLDGAALTAAASGDAVSQRWKANTDEAITHATIGVPTYVVDGEVFFGQDRLEFLERLLNDSNAPPVFLIGAIKVKDADLWRQYVEGVTQSLRPFMAEVQFRGQRTAQLAGDSEFDQAVVIRFKDQATLQAWFDSSAYQILIPLRDKAAQTVIAGYQHT